MKRMLSKKKYIQFYRAEQIEILFFHLSEKPIDPCFNCDSIYANGAVANHWAHTMTSNTNGT